MVQQHLSSSKPVLSNPCPAPLSNVKSRKVPEDAAQSLPLLQPGEEGATLELHESERQAWFQNKSNDILDIPNSYLKVAVLIIRWDERIDEFKGHDQEIERLRSIFNSKFGYECIVAQIENRQNPQIDLNFAILEHVKRHDGPDNLLIVYYTGHGNLIEDVNGEHRLELSATRNWVEKRGTHRPIAFWNDAEKPLLQLASADVLSILDCCFASSAVLTKSQSEGYRKYKLLAACPPFSPTTGPGKNSFTTALSESLEELLVESGGSNFTATRLAEKITLKRGTQAAPIWDRLQSFRGCVQLARLESSQKKDYEGEPEKASLTLRFSLKDDDLTREQIENLAQQLPGACKEARVPIKRIDWVKMEASKPESKSLYKIVKKVQTMQQGVGAFMQMSDSRRSNTENQLTSLHSIIERPRSTPAEEADNQTTLVEGTRFTTDSRPAPSTSQRARDTSPISEGRATLVENRGLRKLLCFLKPKRPDQSAPQAKG